MCIDTKDILDIEMTDTDYAVIPVSQDRISHWKFSLGERIS